MPLRSNSAYYTEESVFVKVDSSISVLDIDIGVRQKNAMTIICKNRYKRDENSMSVM